VLYYYSKKSYHGVLYFIECNEITVWQSPCGSTWWLFLTWNLTWKSCFNEPKIQDCPLPKISIKYMSYAFFVNKEINTYYNMCHFFRIFVILIYYSAVLWRQNMWLLYYNQIFKLLIDCWHSQIFMDVHRGEYEGGGGGACPHPN
jgi:hypothetical protein